MRRKQSSDCSLWTDRSLNTTCRIPRKRISQSRLNPPNKKSQKQRGKKRRRNGNRNSQVDRDHALIKLMYLSYSSYSVSAMYISEQDLNSETLQHQYSKAISMAIDAELRKGEAAVAGVKSHSEVSFELPQLDGEGESCVFIEVKTTKANDQPQVCKALLVRIGQSTSLQPPQGFCLYPLMLVHGPVIIQRALTDWIERQFDCIVSPLTPSACELFSVLPRLLPQSYEKELPVILRCCTYGEKPVKDNITSIEFTYREALELWRRVYGTGDMFGKEIVHSKFTRAIVDRIEAKGINMGELSLYRIYVPCVQMGAGKLRLMSQDASLQVLEIASDLVLNNLCLDRMLKCASLYSVRD